MKRFYTLATAMAIGATAVMAQTMIVVDKSNNEYRFGVDRIAQITFEEAVDPVVEVKPTFIAPYSGGNVNFLFQDEAGKNMIDLDFWGTPQAKYLEAGTYNVEASYLPFTIDPNYSAFMPDGPDGEREAINGGKMVVVDNDGVYTINIELTTAQGSNVLAHFEGELDSYTSKPVEIKVTDVTMSACKRLDINNPEPGEFYLKLNDSNWNYELTLDLYADETDTALPAGTYTLSRSDDHAIGTMYYQKSSIDIYDTEVSSDKRGNVRFSEATLTVTKAGNTYTLVLETTLMNELKYKITYTGEIADM